MPKNQVVEISDEDDDVLEVSNDIIVNDDMVSARIKGTWVMTWGPDHWDFKDGNRYRIPRDLYNYLRMRSCIYDTL